MIDKKRIEEAINRIEHALTSHHNTVATDVVKVRPGSESWRIDFSKELKDIEILKDFLNQ